MSDFKILDIPTIHYNTIGTQEADQVVKCNTNTDNSQGPEGYQLFTNQRPEADRPEMCYTNTGN